MGSVFFFKDLFIYFREEETERKRERAGEGAKGEGPSSLPLSTEPNTGLDLVTQEIRN